MAEVAKPAEGSVDWDAASAFMQGQRQEDESEAGDQTEQSDAAAREFSYKGKKLKVDPETHEVLSDLLRQSRGQNGRLGAELARTRERLAKVEGILVARGTPEPAEPDIKPPDPKLAIQDIAAWQREYDAYRDAREEQSLRRLEQKYLGDQDEQRRRADEDRRSKEWADKFYSTNEHLDDPDVKPVVGMVYAQHKPEIDEIEQTDGLEAAHARLAELADAKLVRVKTAGKTVTNNRRPPRIESSGGAPRTVESAPDESRRNFGAGAWLSKERQRMRGGAKTK